MNAKQLMDVIGQAQDGYIESALRSREAAARPHRFSRKRIMLIAALITLSLLLVGCAVVYVLNLQDMKLGEETYIQRTRQIDENGDLYILEREVQRAVLSLQGLEGTPGFLATQEWQEYEASLDPEAILDALDAGTFEKPRAYAAYGVYDQASQDKVDEIAAKYGLKLAGQDAFFTRDEPDFFLDSLKLDALHEEALAQVQYLDGYFYECGNFNVEFQLTLPQGMTQFPAPVMGTFRYHDKEYFYPLQANIIDSESCQQWNHTTPSGQQVLIVQDGSKYAKVFCDREDAFLHLLFQDEYVQEDGTWLSLTKEEVQWVVDAFDFSVKPQKPDMEAVNAHLEEVYAEAMAEQEAKMETYVDPFALESYGEYVEYLIAQTQNPESMLYGRSAEDIYYTILDFNGDGVEDFLHGPGENIFNTIVTMQEDGTTELLYGQGCDSYLCEGNIIEESYPNQYYRILKYQNNTVTERWNFEYDAEKAQWFHVTFLEGPIRSPVTEDTVQSVMDSHKRIELNMKPLSEFTDN